MVRFSVRSPRQILCLLVIAVKSEPVPAATSLACNGSMTTKVLEGSSSSSLPFACLRLSRFFARSYKPRITETRCDDVSSQPARDVTLALLGVLPEGR